MPVNTLELPEQPQDAQSLLLLIGPNGGVRAARAFDLVAGAPDLKLNVYDEDEILLAYYTSPLSRFHLAPGEVDRPSFGPTARLPDPETAYFAPLAREGKLSFELADERELMRLEQLRVRDLEPVECAELGGCVGAGLCDAECQTTFELTPPNAPLAAALPEPLLPRPTCTSGQVWPEPFPTDAISVETTDSLAAAILAAPPSAVLALARGTHVVDFGELDRDVSFLGACDETILEGPLSIRDARVSFADLELDTGAGIRVRAGELVLERVVLSGDRLWSLEDVSSATVHDVSATATTTGQAISVGPRSLLEARRLQLRGRAGIGIAADTARVTLDDLTLAMTTSSGISLLKTMFSSNRLLMRAGSLAGVHADDHSALSMMDVTISAIEGTGAVGIVLEGGSAISAQFGVFAHVAYGIYADTSALTLADLFFHPMLGAIEQVAVGADELLMVKLDRITVMETMYPAIQLSNAQIFGGDLRSYGTNQLLTVSGSRAKLLRIEAGPSAPVQESGVLVFEQNTQLELEDVWIRGSTRSGIVAFGAELDVTRFLIEDCDLTGISHSDAAMRLVDGVLRGNDVGLDAERVEGAVLTNVDFRENRLAIELH